MGLTITQETATGLAEFNDRLGDARLAQDMANRLFDEGVYVSGFFFPVVPRGKARIRTQMNATLTKDELDRALAAFGKVGKELGVI